jgi:hypothetical protein
MITILNSNYFGLDRTDIADIDALPQTLPFIQGPPAEAFKLGLELFSFSPVGLFPDGRAIIEADFAFPEGGGKGQASGVAAGLAVGHGKQFQFLNKQRAVNQNSQKAVSSPPAPVKNRWSLSPDL